jgi:hypothetical protein
MNIEETQIWVLEWRYEDRGGVDFIFGEKKSSCNDVWADGPVNAVFWRRHRYRMVTGGDWFVVGDPLSAVG